MIILRCIVKITTKSYDGFLLRDNCHEIVWLCHIGVWKLSPKTGWFNTSAHFLYHWPVFLVDYKCRITVPQLMLCFNERFRKCTGPFISWRCYFTLSRRLTQVSGALRCVLPLEFDFGCRATLPRPPQLKITTNCCVNHKTERKDFEIMLKNIQFILSIIKH